jgi:hypothetical protein
MNTAEAPGFTGTMLAAYLAALRRGMTVHQGRQPSADECASVRQIRNFAAMFEPPKPPTSPLEDPRRYEGNRPSEVAECRSRGNAAFGDLVVKTLVMEDCLTAFRLRRQGR